MKELDSIYRRLLPALLRYAGSLLHDSHAAEDLVAEAFARATQQLLVAGKLPERAWYFVVIKHLAFDHLRKRRPDCAIEPERLEAHSGWSDPVARVEGEMTRLQVLACLEELPEPSRRLLVLREFEDCDYLTIARKLNLSLDQVKVGLFRARQKLREIYGRNHGLQTGA